MKNACTINRPPVKKKLDNKPVEFDVLSKIHANNKNGPSITILKWTLDMQPLPVYHFKKWPDGLFILFN